MEEGNKKRKQMEREGEKWRMKAVQGAEDNRMAGKGGVRNP